MVRRCAFVCLLLFTGLRVGAQDPLRTLPKNYWVEFSNPWVRVIHVRYLPHEMVPLHDHPGPATLFVYLSDAGQVRFLHAESDVVDGARPPVKTGQMRLSPGKTESHRVQNLSDQQSDFLRVEFPSVPLDLADFDKRIAPADPAFWQTPVPDKVEFDDTHLRVTRLGVLPGESLVLKAPGDGKTVWLAVAVDGGIAAGKPLHAGEAWTAQDQTVVAQKTRLELLRLELK